MLLLLTFFFFFVEFPNNQSDINMVIDTTFVGFGVIIIDHSSLEKSPCIYKGVNGPNLYGWMVSKGPKTHLNINVKIRCISMLA